MSSPLELLKSISKTIFNIKTTIKKLQKYKSNQHYKKTYEDEICDLNRDYKFLKAKTHTITKQSFHEKLQKLDSFVTVLLSNTKYEKKLEAIKQLELFWPDLEIELSNVKSFQQSFEIPNVIPMNEQRLDLAEAIKDYDDGCYLSSHVLCRRSYEGTLVQLYKSIVQKDPVEDVHCPKCKATIRHSYMGIVKLHLWALENNLITEKLKQVGFLVSDIGAGGAHPPLKDFSRDPEMAKLCITATITLLNELYSKK